MMLEHLLLLQQHYFKESSFQNRQLLTELFKTHLNRLFTKQPDVI